ncbi:MAG TPA: hypothetical protein VKY73_04430 [Polyangiaceae bacterium]|nr:hypothetical protein [Polyangiaceae bacterium]
MDSDAFRRAFRRSARRVQTSRVLTATLSHAASGAVLGAVLSGGLWLLRLDELRWLGLAGAALGAASGAWTALRRRWTDAEIAQFLDARLHAPETVTTAVLATGSTPDAEAMARARALALLDAAPPRRLRPRVLARVHALLPVGLALTVASGMLPLPPASADTPPGSGLVRKKVSGLERIEALEHAPALSPADAERLRALAREARALSLELERGMEQREASARVAELRERVAAARERFGDSLERAGLDAAVNVLEGRPETRKAGRALGEGDLVAFDDAMRQLAELAEDDARRAARDALREAAEAARGKGSKRLAEMLEQKLRELEGRERLLRALRELGNSLGDRLDETARQRLAELGKHLDPESLLRLSEALARALEGLDEAEKKRLLEQLERRLAEQDGDLEPMDSESLEALLRQLETPEGRRALEAALRALAERSADAERDRMLEDAERGGAEAERELGLPLPVPGPRAHTPEAQEGSPNVGDGSGPPAAPSGSSREVPGDELRSRADAALLPGTPLGTSALGRAPAEVLDGASPPSPGALGAARARELSGIEGSDVPEDYREHVGRYFEP